MVSGMRQGVITLGRSVANLVSHSFQASRFSGGKYWSIFCMAVEVRLERAEERPDVRLERPLVEALEVADEAAEAMTVVRVNVCF
jgi:hypothetical protein